MDSLKVLIVDDSPIISRKLTMMVELLGYKVVMTAATGTEAIAAYRACRPDVVTSTSQEDCIAQLTFVLDATRRTRRDHGRNQRQPLPPGAGPPLLPPDHRIKDGDGGAGGKRDVLQGIWPKGI